MDLERHVQADLEGGDPVDQEGAAAVAAATLTSSLPVRTNNNYWMIGGLMVGRSVPIDKWR